MHDMHDRGATAIPESQLQVNLSDMHRLDAADGEHVGWQVDTSMVQGSIPLLWGRGPWGLSGVP